MASGQPQQREAGSVLLAGGDPAGGKFGVFRHLCNCAKLYTYKKLEIVDQESTDDTEEKHLELQPLNESDEKDVELRPLLSADL